MSSNLSSKIDSYLSENFDKIQELRSSSYKSIRWDKISDELGFKGKGEYIRKRFFRLRQMKKKYDHDSLLNNISNDIVIKREDNRIMKFNYNTMEVDVEEELSNLDKIINKLASKGVHVNLDLNGGRDRYISRALIPYIGGDVSNVLIISDLHCLPLDTSEVYTNDGWKYISDLRGNERILSYDDGNIFMDNMRGVIIKGNEDVYSNINRGFRMESTLGHRNIVLGNEGEYMKSTGEIMDIANFKDKMVASGIYSNNDSIDISENKLYLIGFMLGDGTKDIKSDGNYLWKINVKKQRKIDAIDNYYDESILTRCLQNNGYIVYRSRADFGRLIDRYLNKDKSVKMNNILSDFNGDQIKVILRGILDSDGSRTDNRNRICLSSINIESMKDIQLLSCLTDSIFNISNTVQDNRYSTFPSDKPLYNGTYMPRRYLGFKYDKLNKRNTAVGCVNVPSGKFICRQGNSVFVTGNCPYDLDGYLSFCRDQQEKFNCGTVIYIGDIVDFHSISYHEKQPEELNPTGEIALARLKLSDWYKTFPNATVIMGNHDLLIYRQAKTAGLLREFIQDPNTIFQAPSTYTFMDELIIGDVLYTHGSTSNAFKKCILENMNMVSGHAHTQCGIMYHQNRHGKKWGMQVGVGIDYASHAFDYAKQSSRFPVTACGVVLNNGSLPIVIPYDENSY